MRVRADSAMRKQSPADQSHLALEHPAGDPMHTSEASQYGINERVYHHAGVQQRYQEWLLMRSEAVALLKYQPAFAQRDILDIGAGTGRTAVYLARMARHYQAIDYSPVMVREFGRLFPDTSVAQVDMRKMEAFDGGSFDFVLASNNVLDAVGHEDRLCTLGEIRRLLRPGGLLMFSSHNRDSDGVGGWPKPERARNPVTQLRLAAHWCVALVNHARLRRLQTFTDEYAIINDEAHDCALLHYYIGQDAQRRQLHEQGFELLDVFDKLGNTVLPGHSTGHSNWLLYVARRIPVS
jgi:SAM-dependent methyltransferase